MATLECDALLLLEKKSLFFGAKWRCERLALSTALLEFSPKPQVVARLQSALYVVVRAFAPPNADIDNKLKLVMEMRTMDDVRRAMAYQTAARTTCVELYVESAHEREQLLAFVNQLPLAVPVAEQVASTPAANGNPKASVAALIDDAFDALSEAQAARTSESNSRALELYKAAELGFARASQLVPDERTQRLFQERRQEIQAVIQALEARVREQGQQPPQRVECSGSSLPAFPEPPTPPAEPTNAASAAPAPSLGLDERLENLKKFAAQQDVERAQREHKAAPDDLRLRLQALKNEQPKAPSVDSLAERFQRLRGGDLASGNAESCPSEVAGGQKDCTFHRQSSVDRIIQQVQEEIALGIVDDLEDHDDGLDSDDDDDDCGEQKRAFPHSRAAKHVSRSGGGTGQEEEPRIESEADKLGKLRDEERSSLSLLCRTMNKAMNLESGHILAVLEGTVAALEAIATLPESRRDGAFADAKSKLSGAVVETLERHFQAEASCLEATGRQAILRPTESVERPETEDEGDDEVCTTDGSAVARRFSTSLHRVLGCIMQDRAVRDTLRKATATTVSLPFAAFTQAWAELIIHVDHVVSTSTEQDECTANTLRESKLRLREIDDDRRQVAFEFAKERETRVAVHLKYTKRIADLQEQLKDTEREMRSQPRSGAASRSSTPPSPYGDARLRRKQAVRGRRAQAADRRGSARPAAAVRHGDGTIAQEQSELERIASATNSLATYFARIDEDRRNQLDELRAIGDAERRRRQRELNLFWFVQKLQVLVRGFLVRRKYRLELQLLAHKKRRNANRRKATSKRASSSGPKNKAKPPAKKRPTSSSTKRAATQGKR